MPKPASSLIDVHTEIKERFLENGDGLQTVSETAAVTDALVRDVFDEVFGGRNGAGIALLAVGGYGRSQLFPYSDVDLLFLCDSERETKRYEELISRLLTRLWDSRLRVSHSVRTPQECTRLAPDNAELHISLLDTRFLCGSRSVHGKLGARLPKFFVREKKELRRNLIKLAQGRHTRHGDTIYHLEPNIKEVPGGLRDFQLACWLSQLKHVDAQGLPDCEAHLPREFAAPLLEAKRFLFAVRCYLHYINGRDNNVLTFDQQEQIAREGAGKAFRPVGDAAEWMRDYFGNVRAVYRLAIRMMEANGDDESLLKLYRDWQSRLSNADFSVTRGKVYLRRPQGLALEPSLAYRLFAFVARHGVPLAAETERRIEALLPQWEGSSPGPGWDTLGEILRLPHAYRALRAMHETGVLEAILPEFELIDNLVIRDFYHRYTADEHTLVTIRTLHELPSDASPKAQQFASLLEELEKPERLFVALLLHDLGKGAPQPDHAERSAAIAEHAMKRLQAPDADREFVRFLIRHHLVMSEVITHRDLSEPETIQEFADLVGTPERLKALTLMTLADTSAVHPRAMTPWRAELLWQLYIATHNYLTKEAQDRRIHVEPSEPFLQRAQSEEERAALGEFLEGLPERYRRTRGPEEVYSHFRLSQQLRRAKAAVDIRPSDSFHEVVVITHNRPFLFASLCATLSSFGLNIEKAEAYSNEKGTVVDTFVVSDPRRTLELNPVEISRLNRSLARLAEEAADLEISPVSERRVWMGPRRRPLIEARVRYDNGTSSKATIFHIIAEDRRGLLFDLASKFSQHECDIQVVLIDTRGRKAIDVFYVVDPDGKKLDGKLCEALQSELLEVCGRRVFSQLA